MPPFRKSIQVMQPYSPPLEGRASKDYLLLDFNEMTVEPSPRVKQALHAFVDSGQVQKYPEYGNLKEVIASYAGCRPEEILATNGSDQGIDIVMRAFVEKGDTVVIPSPSFAMEYQAASLQGAEIQKPRYEGENLALPTKEVLSLLEKSPKLLVLCNPNNPTGGAISKEELKQLLKKAKEYGVAILHDEAYFEFSGITALEFVKDFDNLFLSRTLSKQFGLASTRAGYVISQQQNIQELMKIRGPYDVNMFAKTAVIAALEDKEYSQRYIRGVMEEAKPRLEEFFLQKKVKFFPSAANFLLVQTQEPKQVVAKLQEQGILVRPREDPPGTIRVSIGTREEIERFKAAFTEALSSLQE